MKRDVLKSILTVFEQHQAVDILHSIKPKEFKNLEYSTTVIVKMLGQLIENRIVICNENKEMYLDKESWNRYYSSIKKKTIMACIGCCLLSLLLFILMI